MYPTPISPSVFQAQIPNCCDECVSIVFDRVPIRSSGASTYENVLHILTFSLTEIFLVGIRIGVSAFDSDCSPDRSIHGQGPRPSHTTAYQKFNVFSVITTTR